MYDPVNCTKFELTEAVFRSLAVDYYPMPSPGEEDSPTDVGYVCYKTSNKNMHTSFSYCGELLNKLSCFRPLLIYFGKSSPPT